MDRAQEQQLYRMQADLCQTLADPTRLEMLSLLGEGSKTWSRCSACDRRK
jgi:hypothetical protein